VIIHNLYIKRIAIFKTKTDSPLARTVVSQGFQPVRWWKPKIANLCGRVQLRQSHARPSLDIGRQPTRPACLEES